MFFTQFQSLPKLNNITPLWLTQFVSCRPVKHITILILNWRCERISGQVFPSQDLILIKSQSCVCMKIYIYCSHLIFCQFQSQFCQQRLQTWSLVFVMKNNYFVMIFGSLPLFDKPQKERGRGVRHASKVPWLGINPSTLWLYGMCFHSRAAGAPLSCILRQQLSPSLLCYSSITR